MIKLQHPMYIDPDKQAYKIVIPILSINKHVFWVLKRIHLIEMVLLSTHNIFFGWEIRKLF